MCVCVFTSVPKSNVFKKQGGNESLSIHCPTKTVDRDCDIDLGRQIDVPAFVQNIASSFYQDHRLFR